jgi:outer membrane protein insertion porin family
LFYFLLFLFVFLGAKAIKPLFKVFVICVLFIYNSLTTFGVDKNIISNNIIPSERQIGNYEIWAINFIGNTYFSDSELLEYTTLEATSLSFPHKILLNLYENAKRNPFYSNYLAKQLKSALSIFEKEYRYFNKELAEIDVSILYNLYNTNGFHFAEIYFEFTSDTIKHTNLLNFYITENEQYKISSIQYKGLEDLPADDKERVNQNSNLLPGDYFNEYKIETEMQAINLSLLNRGYLFSKWSYPNVIMDTTNCTDSIIGYFDTGKKIRFGDIIFADSTNNQKNVANSTKRNIITFREGSLYSKWRIDRSIENLLSLGTFESVSIDTLKRNYAPDENIRDVVVTCNYRKLKEWDVGLFLNQTQVDNLVNAGASFSIKHLNLFGSAQLAQFFTDFSFKDVNYFLSKWKFPDYRFKIGASYGQPLLWKLNTSRISASASLIYSLETINDLFKISKISLPIKFPIKLPRFTYFNSMQVDLTFERENPLNFDEVLGYALDSAKTRQDTNSILRAFTLYGNINNYLSEAEVHVFTSNLLSISITGDKRNHPFSPTNGHLSFIGFDGLNIFFSHTAIAGSAKYFRGQILHNHYWKLSPSLVLAAKGKLGLTHLMNEANAFVPFERQFFAGGANSVRGWPARELRYYTSNILNNFEDMNTKDYAINYIGSRTLIEGSCEFRKSLANLPGINENLNWLFNDIWATFFVDIGNTFGWYLEDEIADLKKNKLTDYITKLAVATGVGLRYETPVGPIRIDIGFPIYDPMKIKNALSDYVIHFGIGHAF